MLKQGQKFRVKQEAKTRLPATHHALVGTTGTVQTVTSKTTKGYKVTWYSVLMDNGQTVKLLDHDLSPIKS